jgi:aminoglycoside/choline kinase family phosphotransferase
MRRAQFLGHDISTLTPLPADASARRYFRYKGGLLMDASPGQKNGQENVAQFMRIAQYLISLGFSAPRLFKHDVSLGFLALEDFGDTTYTRLLEAGGNPYPLYNLAIDTLIALHQKTTSRPEFILPYDRQTLLQEACQFIEWCLPALLGEPVPANDMQAWIDVWMDTLEKLEKSEGIMHSLVLRDYHVDNLIYLKDRSGVQACGLLDFQDALWGPTVYDIVSLLEDARMDLHPELVTHCWQRYFAAFPQADDQTMRNAGYILSAGRHAKILGIFMRLSVQGGKMHYAAYLPRVWRLLQACLHQPVLLEVRQWFNKWSPLISKNPLFHR